MWLIEAFDYPNTVLNGAPGNNGIKICEDTNGDGRADKFTIFADHLNVPTSLAFANGGGRRHGDAEHPLSQGHRRRRQGRRPPGAEHRLGRSPTLTRSPRIWMYAPDNRIWGVVGYSGFNGQMNGKPMRFSQGVYRFKPDGSDFEVVTGSTNNTWGLGFSETFDVFGSTANNDPSFYVAIPEPLFHRDRGAAAGHSWAREPAARGIRARPRSTRCIPPRPTSARWTCTADIRPPPGHHLYTARAFPKKVLEPRRVHHRADGASRRPGGHRESGRGFRDA